MEKQAKIAVDLAMLIYRTFEAPDEHDHEDMLKAVATHDIAKLEEMARAGCTIEADLLEEEIKEIKG